MTTEAQVKPASSSSSSASLYSELPLATDPLTPRPRSKHAHSSSNASKRRTARTSTSDFLSDRATSLLIRRVLCPQQVGDRGRATPPPIDELLPPLTSRNDVDLQLYAIIAIVLRDFVQTWYTKITPDEDFVEEVVAVIAHCTRALEQRLRKVDIESLLFDELPDLLDKHIQGQTLELVLAVMRLLTSISSLSCIPQAYCPTTYRCRRSRDISFDVPSALSIPHTEARKPGHDI